MTLFGVCVTMVSHRRIPLVSEEELTGICVFRSCHTLFNFQGSPLFSRPAVPVSRPGLSAGQLCYNTTSSPVCQPLFLSFFAFSFSFFLLCVKTRGNIPIVFKK